ncbi:hypothetical protein GGI35DRAFT_467506 [Trichoderma velutinum]
MRPKLPACDPCRASKLACDHLQPVCTRCRDANRSNRCKYRELPFKKKRKRNTSNPSANTTESPRRPSAPPSDPDMQVGSMVIKAHKYPNPGYLGRFSYTTLFDHIPGTEDRPATGETLGHDKDDDVPKNILSQNTIAYGAKLIEQIRHLLPLSSCYLIIQSWMAKSTNLALASALVEPCAMMCPLIVSYNDKIEDYCAQFCHQNARWETLGLFCTAVSRAATDLIYTECFCKSDQGRINMQKLAMHFSDMCLDMAVSLDCLNDLQLLLQYENFILHSMVDGDQSYHSWKRLGDMTSSLFALGYHQQLEQDPTIPVFLTVLRRSAFARAYSADKNVSIFLGPPPRIHRKYCRIAHNYNYIFETQWTALCAILKEEILDLFDTEVSTDKNRRAESRHALAQWAAVPRNLRLEGPLKQSDSSPVVPLARSRPQFDAELATVSAEMLGVVTEAIMLKDQLSNSGTSLVWKVAYYGLAAAGIMCLWLLGKPAETRNYGINKSKIVQNLSVLVAAIETGTLVQAHDSNYKLLKGASQTIENLLDRLLRADFIYQPASGPYQEAPLLDL